MVMAQESKENPRFASPEEELAFLREQVARKEGELEKAKEKGGLLEEAPRKEEVI